MEFSQVSDDLQTVAGPSLGFVIGRARRASSLVLVGNKQTVASPNAIDLAGESHFSLSRFNRSGSAFVRRTIALAPAAAFDFGRLCVCRFSFPWCFLAFTEDVRFLLPTRNVGFS